MIDSSKKIDIMALYRHTRGSPIFPRRHFVCRNASYPPSTPVEGSGGSSFARPPASNPSTGLDSYGVFIYKPRPDEEAKVLPPAVLDDNELQIASASQETTDDDALSDAVATELYNEGGAAESAESGSPVASAYNNTPLVAAPLSSKDKLPLTSSAAASARVSAKVQSAAYSKTQKIGDDTRSFTALLLLCFIGAVISAYLFYQSFYSIASTNAKPIAYVAVKTKIAQRKFLDRMAWDRIGQNSAIYNGDTIHTGALSEVTVRFVDGTVIELYDNTMVQVFLNEKGKGSADLTSGSAKVDASRAAETSQGFSLASGETSVTVTAGSSVAASKTDEGDTLQVVKGNAEVAAADGEVKTLEAGEATATSSVIMLSPLPNEKIVYYSEGEYTADFKWQCDKELAMVTLEVASDKNYKNIISRIKTDTGNAQVRLAPARYYWRIREQDAGAWVEGKMSVAQSLPPKAVTPADGYVYSYRTKVPQVRLIWTESNLVLQYKVTVSASPDMTHPIVEQSTQITSMTLPALPEGVYYWQVAAYMDEDSAASSLPSASLSAPSATRSFRIEHKSSLPVPVLYMPADRSAVNIQEAKDKKGARIVNFSWKREDEAKSYHIKVFASDSASPSPSRIPRSSPCVIDDVTEVNLYSAKASVFEDDTQYWWCVSCIDSEGNESPATDLWTFTALDGMVEQRLNEPLDGYTVSSSLVSGLKFTWEKKVPHGMTTYFEVARDESFDNVLLSTTESELYKKGVALNAGEYYWRIRTLDGAVAAAQDDSGALYTPARKLIVSSPFASPLIISPVKTQGKTLVVADENSAYKFAWHNVEKASFYRIAIFDKTTGEEVYSSTVYAPEDDIDMYHNNGFVHRKQYRYAIQGGRDEKPGISSALEGQKTIGDFTFVRRQGVVILSPVNGQTLDGIDTLLNGVEVRYESVDPLGQAQVVLSRVTAGKETVLLERDARENPLRINTKEGLEAGTYEVAVKAMTTDGIDVSSTIRGHTRFSVLPIAPLSSAASFDVLPHLFDGEYIKRHGTTLVLSWQNVEDATDYDIAVSVTDGEGKAGGAKEVVKDRVRVAAGSEDDEDKQGDDACSSFVIDIMEMDEEKRALFTNGNAECTVTPYRIINGKVVQVGKPSTAQFQFDIGKPTKSITLDAVNTYTLKK